MVQRLGQETGGPTMVAQKNMPGLRERIIREAQERGIEFSIRGESDEEGPEEPSDQDSDWYPGRDENEGYGDRAQWMDEYRHIQEYELMYEPLVNPTNSPTAEVPAAEIEEIQPEEEPVRAGQ